MRISKLEDNKIYIEIPLTSQSGKARVKIRNSFYEYGLPTATKQNPFSQKHYIFTFFHLNNNFFLYLIFFLQY